MYVLDCIKFDLLKKKLGGEKKHLIYYIIFARLWNGLCLWSLLGEKNNHNKEIKTEWQKKINIRS